MTISQNQTCNKELRVYICPIAEPYFQYLKMINMPIEDSCASMIKRWSLTDHTTLPPEALDFITLCEESGLVYTLESFQSAINLDDLNLTDSYIFITDKY